MPRGSVSRRGWLGATAGMTAGGVLAACGAGGTGGVGGGTSAAAPQIKTTEPATVQFLVDGAPGTANFKVHEDVKKLFEAKFPQWKIEHNVVQNDPLLVEKQLALIAAGNPADVFWNRVRTSQVFIRRDVLLNVDPYIRRDKIDKNDFWPSAISAYTWQGGYYALPNSASSNVHIVNKRHFQEANVPLPAASWNWDQWLETSRKLTKTNALGQQQYGTWCTDALTNVCTFMWQNGGKPFSDDRKQCLLSSPENLYAMEWLADLVLKHKVAPVYGLTPKPEIANNLVSNAAGGRNEVPGLTALVQQGSLDLTMVPAPRGPKGNKVRGDDLAASIMKTSRVIDPAWEFARLWASDEGQEIVLASTRSYTSRRSVAKNDAILKRTLQPWEIGSVWLDGLERTEVFPITPRFNDVRPIFDAEWAKAIKGEQTVRQALDISCQKIQPLLSEPF
jgi:multiple sugar transport system substrate-binding protein